MKEKIEFLEFTIEEREYLEKHLNEMSEKGWNILGMSLNHILYKESEEVNEYVVDICENPNKNDPYKIDRNVKKQIEMFEEFGYTFVCNYLNFLIFKTNGLERIIHTDNKVEKDLIEEAKRKQRMRTVILPTIIGALLILSFMLFVEGYLLIVLSSAAYMILLLLVVLIHFGRIIIDRLLEKIDIEKRPKLRFITNKIYVLIFMIILGLAAGEIFNSILYPYAFFFGIILIYIFEIKSLNKRFRNEINDGNRRTGFYIFYAVVLFLINCSRLIITDKNPMILSENITGKVNKVIIEEKSSSMFASITDVLLETKDFIYEYTYYKVEDTFLSEFIVDLVHDRYTNMEYKYNIGDTKVYYIEEIINVVSAPDFTIYKMALVHGNDMIVLNHDWIENEEHLKAVIKELGW